MEQLFKADSLANLHSVFLYGVGSDPDILSTPPHDNLHRGETYTAEGNDSVTQTMPVVASIRVVLID